MLRSLKQKLLAEGYSMGAVKVAEIIEENGGEIIKAKLEEKVSEDPQMADGLTDKLVENLEKSDKISIKEEKVKLTING